MPGKTGAFHPGGELADARERGQLSELLHIGQSIRSVRDHLVERIEQFAGIMEADALEMAQPAPWNPTSFIRSPSMAM